MPSWRSCNSSLSTAIVGTERKVAGEAWDQKATERTDASGERSLEAVGGRMLEQYSKNFVDRMALWQPIHRVHFAVNPPGTTDPRALWRG
jgi:hypothetical protein